MRKIWVILLVCFAVTGWGQSLTKIIVFGDSLSDTGNLYEHMQHKLPVSPPYYEGRFTNGLIWTERLIKLYFGNNADSRLETYAFGGAGVSLDDDEGESALFTLKKEVDSYLLANKDTSDDNALFVVWIGANNYLAVPDDVDKAAYDVNSRIKAQIERLVEHGARHFLVVSVPDLGIIPMAKEMELEELLTQFSNVHNRVLEANIKDLHQEYPDVQWLYYDVTEIFRDIGNHPEEMGFSNITDTCYEAFGTSLRATSYMPNRTLRMVASITPKINGDACDGFLFFDPVHPTAPAHQLMAERIYALLNNAGVVFG